VKESQVTCIMKFYSSMSGIDFIVSIQGEIWTRWSSWPSHSFCDCISLLIYIIL